MFRLLNLQPSAKLVDMFVSDEIDKTFEKTREEFLVLQRTQAKNPSSLAANQSQRKTWLWVAGGLGLTVAGGTLVYFLLSSTPEDTYYELP
jgi:hypothetical protein